MTVALQVADTNLTAARILWEAPDQEPAFGSQSYTFTVGAQEGVYWIEAEVQWPDGRRAFATNSVIVTRYAPAELGDPQKPVGGGFSFVLNGTPLATYYVQVSTNLVSWNTIVTNTLPLSGVSPITDSTSAASSRRFYRAMKGP